MDAVAQVFAIHGHADAVWHAIGDDECQGCCEDYPRHCECGGLIHGEIADYSLDWEPLYKVKCDGSCPESETR